MVALGNISGWQAARSGYHVDCLTRSTWSSAGCATKRYTSDLPEGSTSPEGLQRQGDGPAATPPDGCGLGHSRCL